jgi:hypothetical protein
MIARAAGSQSEPHTQSAFALPSIVSGGCLLLLSWTGSTEEGRAQRCGKRKETGEENGRGMLESSAAAAAVSLMAPQDGLWDSDGPGGESLAGGVAATLWGARARRSCAAANAEPLVQPRCAFLQRSGMCMLHGRGAPVKLVRRPAGTMLAGFTYILCVMDNIIRDGLIFQVFDVPMNGKRDLEDDHKRDLEDDHMIQMISSTPFFKLTILEKFGLTSGKSTAAALSS